MNWLTGHMQNPKNQLPMCIQSTVLKKGTGNLSAVKCKEWKTALKGRSCHCRDEKWIPPSLNSASGVSESWGGLVFHMALLNGENSALAKWPVKGRFHAAFTPTERLTSVAKTNVIPLGSFMPIWAAVEQKSHQPLLLLMENCVAASTAELRDDSQVYSIVTNKG